MGESFARLHSRFAIPFSLATSLGLASTALMLPINSGEAGSGLVPPAVADHLLGQAGSALILIMLFMAIVSTGSAESIAVSSLIAYDIYREYFNPEATGKQILWVSRIVIVCFGIFMGLFSIALNAMGLNLGWVYLFMGVVIGSAVIPLWNMMILLAILYPSLWKGSRHCGLEWLRLGSYGMAFCGSYHQRKYFCCYPGRQQSHAQWQPRRHSVVWVYSLRLLQVFR